MGYDLKSLLLAAPAILFSLTVHEFFHAWAANRLGDPTANDMGRLTLNPLAHLDIMGTLMMFLSNFRFGWAKPVPINPYNLRHPRRDDFWISAAGPLSNLGLAALSGILFRIVYGTGMLAQYEAVGYLLFYLITINASLAFFNLLPIFPLDGSHIFRSLLPLQYGPLMDTIDRYSPMILMVLIFSGFVLKFSLIWIILGPFVRAVVYLVSGIQL